MRRFFKALVPATIGSAGTQLALFADTIIASFLSAGAISALYYADRIDQLPIGVIGIAVGTVLVPEMTQRLAAGDETGARVGAEPRHRIRAAPRASLRRRLPGACPTLIMRGLFMRGRFTADDAHAAAMTLMAYTIGLIPFVLIRSVVAPFLARGDTATPVKAALIGTAVNIVCKIALMGPLAQVGTRARDLDRRLDQFRAGALVRPPRRAHRLRCGIAVLARQARDRQWRLRGGPAASRPPSSPRCYRRGLASANSSELIALAVVGGLFYGALVAVLFGRQWLSRLRQRATKAPAAPRKAFEGTSAPAAEPDQS